MPSPKNSEKRSASSKVSPAGDARAATPVDRARRPLLWVALAIVGAVILAYTPALRAPLLYDDIDSIDGNPSIRRLWPPAIPLHPPPQLAVSGRPISNASLAVSYALNRHLSPTADDGIQEGTLGHHLLNLLLHLGCGALLIAALRRTLRAQRYSESLRSSADLAAVSIGALWLIHPIQTEAVNYVVQRTELLVSFFILSMLYAWIRGWDAATEQCRSRWRGGAVLLCFLGMGSKEVMAVAPLLILFYDRAFRVESWKALFSGDRPNDLRPRFYLLLSATLIWLGVLVAGDPRAGTVGYSRGIPWYQYLYSQGWVIAHYAQLALWPRGLIIDYGSRAVGGLAPVPGLLLLIAFAGATIWAWTRTARWGWFAFLGTWFFLILAPSSSVVPISTEIGAERRFYLPLVAVIVLAVCALRTLWNRRRAQPTTPWIGHRGVAVVAGLAAVFGVLTYGRSALYAHPETLYREAIEARPWNVRAYGNLASVIELEPARLDEAVELYRRSLAIDSSYAFAWERLAEIAIDRQQFAEARSILERLLPYRSNNPRILDRLGVVLGSMGEPELAIPYLERATSQGGDAQTWADLGIMYAAANRLDEAIAALTRCLEMDPSRTATRSYLGFVLISAGRSDTAIPILEDAATRDPRAAVTFARLAYAYADVDRGDEAIRAAATALQLAGDEARVYSLAGSALARANRPREARVALERAIVLDPGDVGAREQLKALKGGMP